MLEIESFSATKRPDVEHARRVDASVRIARRPGIIVEDFLRRSTPVRCAMSIASAGFGRRDRPDNSHARRAYKRRKLKEGCTL